MPNNDHMYPQESDIKILDYIFTLSPERVGVFSGTAEEKVWLAFEAKLPGGQGGRAQGGSVKSFTRGQGGAAGRCSVEFSRRAAHSRAITCRFDMLGALPRVLISD